MERARDQLLAGAALPLDQHWGEGPGCLVDQSQHSLDSGAAPDDLREASPALQRGSLEVEGLAPPGGLLVGGPEDLTQVLEVERLRNEVEGAVSGDLSRRGHGAARGRDDDLRRRGHGAKRTERVRPRHARQVQVEEDDADVSGGDLVDPFLSGGDGPDRVPEGREHAPEQGSDNPRPRVRSELPVGPFGEKGHGISPEPPLSRGTRETVKAISEGRDSMSPQRSRTWNSEPLRPVSDDWEGPGDGRERTNPERTLALALRLLYVGEAFGS